jgi:DNA-binding transcriptional MerR regulator
MKKFNVKQLADLSGVSVRTLHLYDEIELLIPAERTEAGYRFYHEKELLRLQQILFYKELGLSLNEIKELLDDEDFDLIEALVHHRMELTKKAQRIGNMLETIDKTIGHLKTKTKMKHEDLYKGFPKEKAKKYRQEAIQKYGKDTIEHAEKELTKMTKADFEALGKENYEIRLRILGRLNSDPSSPEVQELIALFYANIRKFWGTVHSPDKQAEAFAGLGQLYVNDERYTTFDGQPNQEYALFMRDAMAIFAETALKESTT